MSLVDQVQSTIEASGAEMGVAVHHLETGEELMINGDRRFPMASVFKIPVLVEAFYQLQAGELRLDERWTVTDDDKNLGSGILPFFEAGVAPTVLDMLTLMIIISDNTATDLVINALGGPAAVEARMHELGLTNIYFKMTVRQLFEDCLPVTDGTLDRSHVARLLHEQGYRRDGVVFTDREDNNVSSARDMTRLLTLVYNGDLLTRDFCDQMLAILLRQQLNDRLPRFLPAGTRFAHKTGTIGGIRNDAGILYIDEKTHVAVTVFSSWDDQAVWDDKPAQYQRIFEVETAFGRIGRLIYDHYC